MSYANAIARKDASIKGGDISGSKLLALPAELREYIYKLVLTENRVIDIVATHKEPALLSANRQVREEARGVWYSENSFYTEIVNCDDRHLSAFVKHCYSIGMRPDIKLKANLGERSWTNLAKWCENIWNKNSLGYGAVGLDWLSVTRVAAAAHQIVFQHLEHDRSWGECEAALEVLKKVAQGFDPTWK